MELCRREQSIVRGEMGWEMMGWGVENWLESKRVASRKPGEKVFQEFENSQPDKVLLRGGDEK